MFSSGWLINNMYKTVTENDFVRTFQDWEGRENQFTTEALRALYEYFEQYEEDTNEKIELDVIAICCEYSEFKSALEAAQEYGYEEGVDLEPHGSLDILEVAALEEKQATEWLEERTQVIPVEGGGVVIQQF